MQIALSNEDIKRVKEIVYLLVENGSCIECCEYYKAPHTAPCGHTLCHLCWKKRQTCPFCTSPVNRQATKLNLPLQKLTENCHVLCDTAEALLDIKIDDFMLLNTEEVQSKNCPNKNVDEWLGRSQNHFSVPVFNSECSSQVEEHIAKKELLTSEVQIHIPTEKKRCPTNIIHTSIPQDDWDKIEHIPETYEITTNKENIVGPMDIEPFNINDKEYSIINPRRSSRNKELKNNSTYPITEESLVDMHIAKVSSSITDKISCNSKQNWDNVKKMRKEFSKLNKKNKSKLNVSIEMCKKTHTIRNKLNVDPPIKANEMICEIDDNTHNHANFNILQDKEVNKPEHKVNLDVIEGNISDRNKPLTLSNTYTNKTTSEAIDDHSIRKKVNVNSSKKEQISLSRSISSDTNDQDSRLKHNKIKFFKKGILYSNHEKYAQNLDTRNLYIDADSVENNGDIDISIKIGNTLTNIFLKQKKTDVQIKMNMDRAIQTSLGPHHMVQTNSTLYSNNINTQNMQMNDKDTQDHSNKSISIKKNTASTDTATAHLEITESVEKELSTIMECENNRCSLKNDENTTKTLHTKVAPISTVHDVDAEMIHNNDFDIFGSGTMREKNIESLKDSEYASSEILMPTIQIKSKTQNNAEKREREINSGDEDIDEHIQKKKVKVDSKKVDITGDCNTTNNVEDPVNYDELMNQVFANIDADIDDIQQSQSKKDKNDNSNIKNVTDVNVINSQNSISTLPPRSQSNLKGNNNERNSEILFSMIEKYHDILGTNSKIPATILETLKDVLTPVACRNSDECSLQDMECLDDGSDKYVVEDTPQKKQILLKTKQRNDTTKETLNHSREKTAASLKKNENITSHNESSDSRKSSKNNTVIDLATKKETFETPLTINKFVNHILHKSTPVARKSLSFENKHTANDPEETLCPTAESVVKNTQEKEFMYKAFENTPEIIYKPLTKRTNDMTNNKKLCVAGSCLNSDELRKLKYLCNERKWLYVDKYISDITHLVVAVDDQKKCQRSVKYMRALAAGKWIVSFDWVKKCLVAKKFVDESQFEALDYTGEPGPKRSRITRRKLFEGIKFFCMPPFSVLDVDSLKGLLEDAGGVVVDEAKKVQVTDGTKIPCILLAEPENTQEDQFIYLAMKLNIVPVNFEWALNCLGSYTLGPIQELLLCPSSLLPKATSKWPASLFSFDVD